MYKRVFSLLLVAALMLILIAVPVYAEDIQFRWARDTLDDGTEVAVITDYVGAGGDVVIPETLGGFPVTEIEQNTFEYNDDITSVTIPDSVTEIGMYAFAGCEGLARVKMGKNVALVGSQAFVYCAALRDVVFSESLIEIGYAAFANCSVLAEIDLPDSLEIIGARAFEVCTALNNVVVPPLVTEIGSNAFAECSALENITIPDSVVGIDNHIVNDTPYYENAANWVQTASGKNAVLYVDNHLLKFNYGTASSDYIRPGTKTIADNACSFSFSGELILPDGLVYIGDGAFSDSDVTKLRLPDSLTYIGDDAFSRSEQILEVDLPDGLTYLGAGAFYEAGLSRVEIPASLKVLGESGMPAGVFQDCDNLSEVILPEGLEVIGSNAFAGCAKLTKITLPESLTTIEGRAFADTGIREIIVPENTVNLNSALKDCATLQKAVVKGPVDSLYSTFDGCTALTDVTLPDTVIRLDGTFRGCASLERIDLPESVKYISDTFNGCASLKSIDLPEYCNSEGFSFKDCASLTKIVLPEEMTSIGRSEFENCTALKSITFSADVMFIGEDAFKNCTALEEINIIGDSNHGGLMAHEDIFNDTAFYKNPDNWKNGLLMIGCILFDADVSITGRLEVPETVQVIADGAFRDCIELSEVVLHPSVRTVGENAFTGCTSLLKMFVNVTDFQWPGFMGWEDTFALAGCPELTLYSTFDYSGTLEMVGCPVRFEKLNTMKNEETGVIVSEARSGAFLDGMEFVAKEIERTEDTLVYDFSMLRAGQIAQPETTVQVTIPLPMGMRDGNCKVYFIDAAGDYIDMNARQYDHVVVFYTNHFSEYVVEYTPDATPGDVDGSGTVDVADIMKLKALIMADKWSDEERIIGDLDASGRLDVGDIMAVKNIIMSK